MSGLLFQATSFFFFVFLVANSISWICLWEEKEYDLRRLIIYIRETKKGRDRLFGRESIIKWVLIFLYSATIFTNSYDNLYHFVVAFFYFYLFLQVIKKVQERDFALFSMTPITISIFSLTLLFELFLFMFSPLDHFLWILIIDKLTPLLIAIIILFFSVFFDFNKDVIINRALSKIAKQRNLLTIAVVGSYGRGSTREFISQVLSSKYNVVETKTTFNTALGIAKTIVADLTPKKQIFIAEMEDYRLGDIEEMASIINPKIAVICGINEQKMSEFGTIDKVLDSKYEVIESLARDGIALFDGNNKNSIELYSKTRVKKFIYSVAQVNLRAQAGPNADIMAQNVKETKLGLSFDVVLLGKKYSLSDIKLIGRHNIENLLPAIFIGAYMGIDFSRIRRAILNIKPLPSAFEPRKTAKGTIVIDDTYNANINSVLRAAAYARHYKGRKIIVLEPLIELGRYAEVEHEKLGEQIGHAFDTIFLTNQNYYKALLKGIKKSKSRAVVSVSSPAKIMEYIKKRGKEDVAIFEGREARASLQPLKTQPVY